jgi:hypothetical protein
VDNPDLAAAIRRDWAGFDQNRLLAQLTKDAQSQYYEHNCTSALRNLLDYDRSYGLSVCLKLLGRPVYDAPEVIGLIKKRLFPLQSEHDLTSAWNSCCESLGPRGAAVLADILYWQSEEEILTSREDAKRAAEVLVLVAPHSRPYSFDFASPVSNDEQAVLINSLLSVSDGQIDAAVQHVFETAVHLEPGVAEAGLGQGLDDMLPVAAVCFQRMAGKGHDQEYARYFRSIADIPHRQERFVLSQDEIESLQDRIYSLTKNRIQLGNIEFP